MSKITFRADNELIEALESFDASKSEVLREALRTYLENHPEADIEPEGEPSVAGSGTVDELIADRIDDLLEERLDAHVGHAGKPQDVNVNITLEGATADSAETVEGVETEPPVRKTEPDRSANASDEETKTCSQCGENVGSDHVYCPNCGGKMSHRIFCDCGDELRSDWGFCPSCGRRTPAADVLDRS